MTAFAAASWAAIAVVVASLPALIRIGYFQRRRTQRAELVLEQNDRWYRGILDTQSELICRFRPDTTLTFVNEACCRFWRRERPQLLGERLLAVVPEAMRLSLWEQIEATLQSQQIGTRQYQVMLLNDTLGWREWTHHPIADAGGSIVEIQAVGRDITDQRR